MTIAAIYVRVSLKKGKEEKIKAAGNSAPESCVRREALWTQAQCYKAFHPGCEGGQNEAVRHEVVNFECIAILKGCK